jgi:hypothetical protein
LSKTFHDEGVGCNVVVTSPTHREFKATYIERFSGYEEHNFVTGFQNDHVKLIGERRMSGERRKIPMCERIGHTGTQRNRYELKTERRIELSKHES